MLTKAEKNHILYLLEDNYRRGEYYGNKEQYWKRHDRILKKLNLQDRHER